MDTTAELFAFKFLVPSNKWIDDPDRPAHSWKGCVVVAIAADEDRAREVIINGGRLLGVDFSWVKRGVATVSRLDLKSEALLAYAMV